MAEPRSIPTALGIIIGPASAYLSYWIFQSGANETAQALCFLSFAMAGHDIAKGGLSLLGTLFTLLAPTLPIALYLQQTTPVGSPLMSAATLAALWVIGVLLGAVWMGLRRSNKSGSQHLTRLAVLASVLVAVILATRYL